MGDDARASHPLSLSYGVTGSEAATVLQSPRRPTVWRAEDHCEQRREFASPVAMPSGSRDDFNVTGFGSIWRQQRQ